MAKPKRPPWGNLFGTSKPIEQLLPRTDATLGDWAQQDAFARQFKRMCLLKEAHYGIKGVRGWRPWYELAVALASEFDKAVTLIDPQPQWKGKTAPRWKGAEGVVLLRYLAAIRDDGGNADMTIDGLLEILMGEAPRYRDMDFDTLRSRYSDSVRYHPAIADKLGFKRSSTKQRSK